MQIKIQQISGKPRSAFYKKFDFYPKNGKLFKYTWPEETKMKHIFYFLWKYFVILFGTVSYTKLENYPEERCPYCGAINCSPGKTQHWFGFKKLFFLIITDISCDRVICNNCKAKRIKYNIHSHQQWISSKARCIRHLAFCM